MATPENFSDIENRHLRTLLEVEIRKLQRQVDDNSEKIKDHKYRLNDHGLALRVIALSAIFVFFDALIILAASK